MKLFHAFGNIIWSAFNSFHLDGDDTYLFIALLNFVNMIVKTNLRYSGKYKLDDV